MPQPTACGLCSALEWQAQALQPPTACAQVVGVPPRGRAWQPPTVSCPGCHLSGAQRLRGLRPAWLQPMACARVQAWRRLAAEQTSSPATATHLLARDSARSQAARSTPASGQRQADVPSPCPGHLRETRQSRVAQAWQRQWAERAWQRARGAWQMVGACLLRVAVPPLPPLRASLRAAAVRPWQRQGALMRAPGPVRPALQPRALTQLAVAAWRQSLAAAQRPHCWQRRHYSRRPPGGQPRRCRVRPGAASDPGSR